MTEYRNRIVDAILHDKLEAKGAVLIEGPKWCGKTTTAAQQARSILHMDNPAEKDQNLSLARLNPQRLLKGETPRLIDEWQIAPALWDTIRYEVDQRSEMGQFILTGSAVPPDTKEITHSGTGRFSWLLMRPMSLFESGDSSGEVSLGELFKGNLDVDGENQNDIEKLAFLICRGGWPGAIDLNEKPALRQAFDYYEGVVRSDINRSDGNAKNEERVRRIMRSFARNQGSQTTATVIAKDILANDASSVNEDTVRTYIEALKKIFVVEDMAAWNPNLRSKSAIRTSDTRYYVDPSIAVASLGVGPEDLLNDLNTCGLFFETLCVRDLRVFAESLDGSVYHYRDNTGLECDAVVHLRNGKYGLIEIKLGGDSLIEEGAENLKRLSSKIDVSKMKSPSFLMVLTGVGHYAYKREDGVLVVPIGCLRN
ncbi:MAG: ATP-binding protein [Treponema sp.]|nr:ATP-binding protein [Treponema sp.]